ncbi:MAG: endonuclease/exonuclease/phosphatase family protein [Gemmatimonadota bacterium]
MRLTSFNLRQGGSPLHWEAIIAATTPDVLLVQESKESGLPRTHWEQVPGRRWGSAVLLKRGRVTPIPIPGFTGWVVGGAWRNGYVFSVHIPPIRGNYHKSAHALLDLLRPIVAGSNVILGGDWNITAGRRRDDEARRTSKPDHEFLDRLERDFGLQSAWCIGNPGVPLAQTLRWMNAPQTPYHCDGIFVNVAKRRKVRAARVLSGAVWTRLSDHNPVVVDWG